MAEREFRLEPVLENDRFWCPQCKEERKDPDLSGFCSVCGHILEYIDEGADGEESNGGFSCE
jgi:hypothetical protein